jgi:integrase
MTVRRCEKTGHWFIDVVIWSPDGVRKRIRRVVPGNTRRKALQYEAEIRSSFDDENSIKKEVEVPLFRDFAIDFLDEYSAINNKLSEFKSKASILKNHLVPFFGGFRIDSIAVREIEKYKAVKVGAGLAAKTINNQLTVLRKILSVAVEWGLIEVVPPIKWLKPVEPKFDFLSFEEADRLIEFADDRWRPMIVVALKTGLRLGELLGLQRDCVDFDRELMTVRRAVSRGVLGTPKNHRTRMIPLGKAAIAALKSIPKETGDFVFCNQDGSLRTESQCKRPLKRAFRDAGLRELAWHALRHTFASHLVMKGAPLRTVQELMGHSDIRMTMRYSHLTDDAVRKAVSLLG